MSDGSDFDDDIDQILSDLGSFDKKTEKEDARLSKIASKPDPEKQERIDSAANKPERETSAKDQRRGSFGSPTKLGSKTPETPASPSFARRFPSTIATNQEKGSNLLSSLFATEDDKSKRPNLPEPTKPFPPSSAKSYAEIASTSDKPKAPPPVLPKAKAEKGDWLGVSKDKDEEDSDDILRALRFGGGGGGESKSNKPKTEKPPLKPTTKMDDDEDSSIIERLNRAKKVVAQSQPQPTEPKTSFEDKLPQSLNFGQSIFEDKFSLSPPPVKTPSFSAFAAPQPQSQPIRSQPQPQPPNENEKHSFLQSLFGASTNVNTEKVEIPDSHQQDTTEEVAPAQLPKKKVAVGTSKKQGSNLAESGKVTSAKVTTLQVASHLIDEDELKTMSSSLKTIYANQLDMMEKSFAEQMVCMTQSHNRKEEMLKEEIRIVHKEYESRLERLKNQLVEAENRSVTKQTDDSNNGFSIVNEQLKTLLNKLDLITVQQSSRITSPPGSTANLAENSDQVKSILKEIVDPKFNSLEKSMDDKLEKLMRNSTGSGPVGPELKELSSQIETSDKKRHQDMIKLVNSVLEGTANTLTSAVHKLSDVQKKVGENLSKKILTSITEALEAQVDLQRKSKSRIKEKESSQIKDFRDELHRFSLDLESKNELVRKSQTGLENEQKLIAKSFIDLNQWLQIHFTRNALNIGTQQSNLQNSSMQSELEIQLLQEERKSMSEFIAEVNVERRKLNEEKVALEKERRELERERTRMQELQISLKMKLGDAEDLQKQVETSREENYRLGAEIIRQQNEIEKDRFRQKESLRSIEENLRLQQENLFREKMDILRDKEFFEKIRNQLLCPGCLKSLALTGQVLHNETLTGTRTTGDGVDKSAQQYFHINPIRVDSDDHLKQEIRFLDDLYLGFSKS